MRFLKSIRQNLTRHIAVPGLVVLGLAGFSAAEVMAATPDPYARADRSWITLNGEVESVKPDSFVLDYEKGKVIVEMDDGDRDADAYKLMPGDEVTVSGRIDDDFFETTSIEAYSVYVKNIDTTFFASSLDDEGPNLGEYTITVPLEKNHYSLIGTVTKVNDDEFVLDTGVRSIQVAVDEMAYNPLDEVGYQKIHVGDRVSVSGNFDYDFFEGRQFEAESVMKLVFSES